MRTAAGIAIDDNNIFTSNRGTQGEDDGQERQANISELDIVRYSHIADEYFKSCCGRIEMAIKLI